MGLFSALKNNLHHGGVTVQVNAPSSISDNQPVQIIPATPAV